MIGTLLDCARPQRQSAQEAQIARVMSIIARFRAWRAAWRGSLLLLASLEKPKRPRNNNDPSNSYKTKR
jgi:hypothetical protein